MTHTQYRAPQHAKARHATTHGGLFLYTKGINRKFFLKNFAKHFAITKKNSNFTHRNAKKRKLKAKISTKP